jgi:hypothetical protein
MQSVWRQGIVAIQSIRESGWKKPWSWVCVPSFAPLLRSFASFPENRKTERNRDKERYGYGEKAQKQRSQFYSIFSFL